jgi:hypothetical protein
LWEQSNFNKLREEKRGERKKLQSPLIVEMKDKNDLPLLDHFKADWIDGPRVPS